MRSRRRENKCRSCRFRADPFITTWNGNTSSTWVRPLRRKWRCIDENTSMPNASLRSSVVMMAFQISIIVVARNTHLLGQALHGTSNRLKGSMTTTVFHVQGLHKPSNIARFRFPTVQLREERSDLWTQGPEEDEKGKARDDKTTASPLPSDGTHTPFLGGVP